MTSPRPDDHDGRRETGVAEPALSGDIAAEAVVILMRLATAAPVQEPEQEVDPHD